MQARTTGKKLFTIDDWVQEKKHPPANTIRRLIFNAEKNGFNTVVRRIGRRIYLIEDEFYSWLDEQNAENLR